MNMLDAVLSAQNGGAVRQIGSQLGLSEDRTAAALAALVPALAAGLQRNAESPGGLNSLLTALAGGRHGRYVEDPATLSQPNAIEDGNGILSHVFGSKEVSRRVAAQAAARTGVGADVVKRMLPMAAALMMGTLARESSPSVDALPLAGGAAGSASAGGMLMGLLRSALDRNRDGSMVDDLIGAFGALRR